ncbi:hypothetical protein BCR34DRAFT_649710 [Clohesyomyces aquaticus]|uniref:Basic proline-rich protein n=1 Tax=Clohesyomyces aquaticus TaxID=1231657 RepID=A0A1Y1ZSK9_9PLEO|nr:hypothetical protein BCR34DRAFT_649710 [Clohesyomyces aquaticus]
MTTTADLNASLLPSTLAPSITAELSSQETATTIPSAPSKEDSMSEANSLSRQTSNTSDEGSAHQWRPSTPRAQTDPSPDSLPTHHPRPRNRSPYSRSHFRSHSGSSSLSAPPMTRAHSLPTVISPTGHLALSPSPMPLARPSSPLRSPKRTRSPFRTAEDSFIHSGAPSVCDISEDADSLTRSGRRRPASPLHQVTVPFGTSATSAPSVGTPTSTHSSPLLSASKFNEPFPGLNAHYPSSLTSSSVPSTPTSMRSRSPSISSLETIPDTPDAEAEAIEADRIAKLKAAADREKEGTDGMRRSSLDVPGGTGRTLGGFGKRDSRKRWSVCGAERRGDLDLETIWED